MSTGSLSAMTASSRGSRTGPNGSHTRCPPLPALPPGGGCVAAEMEEVVFSPGNSSALSLTAGGESLDTWDPQPSLFSRAPRWFP